MMETEDYDDITALIIGSAITIHRELGPGLFESVYEELLAFELEESGLSVQRQVGIPLYYKSRKMEVGFRADLIVEEAVIVEIKSVEAIARIHKKQVLTYLKLSGLKIGLLINFNAELLKDGITRLVNNFGD
jgi:GxxExxY protein